MKIISKYLLVLLVLAGTSSLNNIIAQDDQEAIKPMAEFDITTYDFGKIEQGIPAKAIFKIKNTSMVPLVINRVSSSCGCTVPNYPKEPIRPGETDEIIAVYNAKSPGRFTKTITVYSNALESTTKLYIKGEVVPKTEASKIE